MPAFLRASIITSLFTPSTPNFPSFDGSLLRFSFPNMSGIYTFMSCSFGTIPFKKERIVKPAESLSVKISIPLVSAKRRISFCLFLSLNIPNPSVSIIRVSSIFDTFILSYLPSTMTACFICIIYCSLRSNSTSSFSRIIFSSVTLILSFLSASFNESRFLRRVFMLILRLS
jgi:hypothetical protein